MDKLKNIRLHILSNNGIAIEGDGERGLHKEFIVDNSTECLAPSLTTSWFSVCVRGYPILLKFSNFNMDKPIPPLRIMGKRPIQKYLYAVYCLAAEASYYKFGFTDHLNKEYLMQTKEIAVFYNDKDFDIDMALNLFLHANGGIQ